jgi:hypothetical protein
LLVFPGVLGKTGFHRGVFVVSLWWIVWLAWMTDPVFFSSGNFAIFLTLF